MLVYGAMHPCDGDWFGGLSAENAEEFLDALEHMDVRGGGWLLWWCARCLRGRGWGAGLQSVEPAYYRQRCEEGSRQPEAVWRAAARVPRLPLAPSPQIGADGGAEDPVLRRWWRGRMGLAREEQRELYAEGGGVEALSELEEDGGEGELQSESEWEGGVSGDEAEEGGAAGGRRRDGGGAGQPQEE